MKILLVRMSLSKIKMTEHLSIIIIIIIIIIITIIIKYTAY